MANPAADYPSSLHDATNVAAYSQQKLGSSAKTHTQVHGKVENELVAIQEKLGIGDSKSSDASTGQVLKKQSDGSSKWSNETDPIWNSEKSNYYTKSEFSNLFEPIGSSSSAISTHESTYNHSLIATALQPGNNVSDLLNDAGYLTAETDPVFSASASAGITSTNISNWNSAYSWGNHAGLYDLLGTASGLMSAHELAYNHSLIATAIQVETDPVFTAWDRSTGISITASQVSDFDTEVSNNTDVAANTSARHSAVTLGTNTATALSLTGQQLSLADVFVQIAGDTMTGALTTPGVNISTLTQGSVVFSGASGALSQDNANLFWDDSNNRLGVGTALPAKLLDVRGNADLGSRGFTSTIEGTYKVDIRNDDATTNAEISNLMTELKLTQATNSAQRYYAEFASIWTASGNTSNYTNRIAALQFQSDHYGSGTVTDIRGLSGIVANRSTGTLTTAYGGWFGIYNLNAGGTITNAHGLFISNGSDSGTLTSKSGVTIEALTADTNVTHLLIGTSTIPTGTFGVYNSSTASNYFAGSVGVGTTAPSSNYGGVDIASGGLSLVLGATLNAQTRTDATTKYSRIGGYHYTNAEEPTALMYYKNDGTTADVYIGGGTSQMNAASNVYFYTAANVTTTTGTARGVVNSSGYFGFGTISPSQQFEIAKADVGPVLSLRNVDSTNFIAANILLGSLQFTSNAGDGTPAEFASIRAYTDGTASATSDYPSRISFYTTPESGGTALERVRIDKNGRLGVAVTSILGQAHIDQPSTTGAIPVLYLNQVDVSEEMIELVSTAGVGNAIELVGSKTLTTTEFIKVTINGNTRYLAAGTIA